MTFNIWTLVSFIAGCICGRFIAAWNNRADGLEWTAKTPWDWRWRFALIPTRINTFELYKVEKGEVWIWMRGYYSRLSSDCSSHWSQWHYYENALTPVPKLIWDHTRD